MSLDTRQSLPASVKSALDALSTSLQAELGPQLHSLVLYGGVLRGRYFPNSDVNLLIVLNDTQMPTLKKMEKPLELARRQVNLAPFILGSNELAQVADVFSVKLLDIQRQHQLLFGLDCLSAIKVEPEHIRLCLEQGLRNLQLRLRLRVAQMGGDGPGLRQHLYLLARPLAIHLAEMLALMGEQQPPSATTEIFRLAASKLKLQAEPLETLAALRNQHSEQGDWTHLADGILKNLELVVQRVDSLMVKS